jgi:hypothetical protein
MATLRKNSDKKWPNGSGLVAPASAKALCMTFCVIRTISISRPA